MCWKNIKDGQCLPSPSHALGAEGLLCYHTRITEGGSSIFLHTSTGRFITIQNGSSALFDPPYRNKYGEQAHTEDKNWEQFQIDEQGGGSAHLAAIKKKFVEFNVGNSILQQRTNPDSKFKVYMRNML